MRIIEAQLHDALLDIAPDMHEIEEQAAIVAEAANLMRSAQARRNKTGQRLAASPETQIISALLMAMDRLQGGREAHAGYISGSGLSSSQIVSRATEVRTAGKMSDSDFLKDDELSRFLNKEDLFGYDANDYRIEDITFEEKDVHPNSLYHAPGTPTHRSDSLSR